MQAYRYTSSMMARGKPTESKDCNGSGTSEPSTRNPSLSLYSLADRLKLCLSAGKLWAIAFGPSAAAEEP